MFVLISLASCMIPIMFDIEYIFLEGRKKKEKRKVIPTFSLDSNLRFYVIHL